MCEINTQKIDFSSFIYIYIYIYIYIIIEQRTGAKYWGSGYCVIFRSCHMITLERPRESHEIPVNSADLEAEM